MVRRMKAKARSKGLSLNRYVEDLIERDLSEGGLEEIRGILRDVKSPSKISKEILDLSSVEIEFSKEELYSDERLSYIMSK